MNAARATPLYRREAVEAAGHRWLGPVAVLLPPGSAMAGVVSGMALFLLGVAGASIEVSEKLSAVGILLPAERLIVVRATRNGIVRGLKLADADAVVAGQTLLFIEPADSAATDGIRNTLASLQREESLQSAAHAAELSLLANERSLLEQRAVLLRQQLPLAQRELALREDEWRLLQTAAARTAELEARGAATAAARDADAIRVVAAEGRVATAANARLALDAQLAEVEAGLQMLAARRELLAASQQLALEALQRAIASARNTRAAELRAAEAGEVGGISVRNGSSVRTGQALLSLYQPGQVPQVWLYVDAADAGRLQREQTLKLRLTAFPHAIYGTLEAEIESISTLPIDGADAAVPLPAGSRVFEIRARLTPAAVRAADERLQLRAGARLQGDIVRARQPLYRWLSARLIGGH